ncbi:MAG: methyltransferase domain-containing protein [Deltaproteobacteria bacterium]|nr:methyltransferase domain-containing protein [Deltaproteobacteria bacterium]
MQPEHRLLDVGCGTGTLTMLLKRSSPDATVVGIDGDPHAPRSRAAGRVMRVLLSSSAKACRGASAFPTRASIGSRRACCSITSTSSESSVRSARRGVR